MTTGQFTTIGASTGWVANALAYNKNDNYLYAISQARNGVDLEDDPCYPAGHLLQIHPETGEVRNLGRVTKPGTEDYAFQGVEGSWSYPNDLWGGINAGEFDLNGNLWVSNSSGSSSSQMYKVDINNVTAVQTNAKLVAEDYALSTDGRYLFGIKTNRADDRILLERFDLVTQAVTEYDITNLRSPVGV